MTTMSTMRKSWKSGRWIIAVIIINAFTDSPSISESLVRLQATRDELQRCTPVLWGTLWLHESVSTHVSIYNCAYLCCGPGACIISKLWPSTLAFAGCFLIKYHSALSKPSLMGSMIPHCSQHVVAHQQCAHRHKGHTRPCFPLGPTSGHRRTCLGGTSQVGRKGKPVECGIVTLEGALVRVIGIRIDQVWRFLEAFRPTD